ncbi:hypothetical protein HMPREF3212_00866 [Citrobacter freundii]|nr:hypothetical protein HMPREF3212_00866 [Citrobacter freundii]
MSIIEKKNRNFDRVLISSSKVRKVLMIWRKNCCTGTTQDW